MDLQTLAIFLLATFCAGGIAWVVVYPYLSGEKEAERRMAGIAKSSVPTGKGISRALKSRREQVETSLQQLEERAKKSKSLPLSIRLGQSGLPLTKRQFVIISASLGVAVFAGTYLFDVGAIPAALLGFAAGFGLPRWILSFLKKRREAKFIDRFPDAIDVVVRGIKAGQREKIRQRERERLARGEKASLRTSPKEYMRTVVEKFKLSEWVGQEAVRAKLVEAGFRGQGPYIVFLFFRMVAPVGMLVASLIYVFLVIELDIAWTFKLGICIGATYLGINLPNLFIKNRIQRRQASINRAFPDALDLLLICVESGMSLEVAFKRVSEEIGVQSIELAEEFTLATAELSYLSDRRQSFENLAKRVPLEGVKSLCMALQQSERFGTPVATALRVIAQENRDQRMTAAEKKAAALPPQLTVPMIVFFLPVLFIVILGPAVIKVMQIQ